MNNFTTPKHTGLSKAAPNPQGKGLRPIADSLNEFKYNSSCPPKQITQISTELFTSLIVLESQIRFKPVFEKSYWLYQKNGDYHLSLISPHEWRNAQAGNFVGECRLHNDLTWSLALSEESMNNSIIMDALNSRREQFEYQLTEAQQLSETLPVYVESFSFYSRILASGLAYSLNASMQKTGIAQLNYDEALQQQKNHKALGYADKRGQTLADFMRKMHEDIENCR